jgi:hypothetical protein
MIRIMTIFIHGLFIDQLVQKSDYNKADATLKPVS